MNVGGPGGLLATDDTVEVVGRLTVGGVILLSDFFRFRPKMRNKQTMFRKDIHDFFFELKEKNRVFCLFLKIYKSSFIFSFRATKT